MSLGRTEQETLCVFASREAGLHPAPCPPLPPALEETVAQMSGSRGFRLLILLSLGMRCPTSTALAISSRTGLTERADQKQPWGSAEDAWSGAVGLYQLLSLAGLLYLASGFQPFG